MIDFMVPLCSLDLNMLLSFDQATSRALFEFRKFMGANPVLISEENGPQFLANDFFWSNIKEADTNLYIILKKIFTRMFWKARS